MKRKAALANLRERLRPAVVDLEWRREFLEATHNMQASARREHLLRYIDRLSPPCRDQYLKHRRQEIKKEMAD